MASAFHREVISEARRLGLHDIVLAQRKKHAVLEARTDAGRFVMMPISRGSHGGGNPRAMHHVVTGLRRQMREMKS